MNKTIIFLVMALVSNIALAAPGGLNEVPIPGVLPLIGIGVLAVYAINHFKK